MKEGEMAGTVWSLKSCTRGLARTLPQSSSGHIERNPTPQFITPEGETRRARADELITSPANMKSEEQACSMDVMENRTKTRAISTTPPKLRY
jgi:hypothetical protein